jgi:hypothetical protein
MVAGLILATLITAIVDLAKGIPLVLNVLGRPYILTAATASFLIPLILVGKATIAHGLL